MISADHPGIGLRLRIHKCSARFGCIMKAASFLLLIVVARWPIAAAAAEINIGSKRFTESYVLGEIATKMLRNEGFSADHRQGMGGTIILWEALKGGAISAYPEYTGTIAEEILHTQRAIASGTHREPSWRGNGVGMTSELGFNNTYALVMRRDYGAKTRNKTHQRLEKSSRSSPRLDPRIP